MRFTRLMIVSVAVTMAVGAGVVARVADAQTARPKVTDPAGPVPDPTHIPMTLPKDLKWTGQEGRQQQAVLFGDPNQAGLYGLIIKWYPGNFSQPHFHDQERYAYVISGTWWVSTTNVYDEKTTYPARAGSVAIDKANTVHWDGARVDEKEPAVLMLVGMGPVKTVQVDETGKPKPAAPAR